MLPPPLRPRVLAVGLCAFLSVIGLQSQAPPILPPDPLVIAGTGAGSGQLTIRKADGTPVVTVAPFGSGFTGGVRVAAGDIDGDGVTDVVAAMAGNGGQVRALSGADGSLLGAVTPFGPTFTGGVFVATGDVNADGHDDVLLGAGSGGLAQLIDGATRTVLGTGRPFPLPYDAGVTVAMGDVTGDGRAELIFGTTLGGFVEILDFPSLTLLASGFPYGPLFTGGVNLAAGDVDGDGVDEIAVAPQNAGGPVRIYNIRAELVVEGTPFGGVQGVNLAMGDLNGDGRDDLVMGAGAGATPRVRAFSIVDGTQLFDELLFTASFQGGVWVATPRTASARFTSAASTTFTAGAAGTFAVTTQNGSDAILSVGGTLPAGVTFTDNGNGTGTLAGTPAAGSGGSYALTFVATRDGRQVAQQPFVLLVQEGTVITSANATTFAIGGDNTFTITTSGVPAAATITLAGTRPFGITFTDNGNGTATLAGSSFASSDGTYLLTVTASNGIGAPATQTFMLTVVAGSTPQFNIAGGTIFFVGSVGSYSIQTSGTPAVNTITVAGALPTGVTFTDNGDGTATLAGIPASGTEDVYSIAFTADNGVATKTQGFGLIVDPVAGGAPTFTSANRTTFLVGMAGDFAVTTIGTPSPTLWVGGTLPDGLTFTDHGDGTASLTGTPAPGTVRNYLMQINAQNSEGVASQSFTLTIANVGATPVFTSGATTAFVIGTSKTFAITTAALPVVTGITLTGTLPTGLTFTDNGDGTASLDGTPQPGTGGAYPLTFAATNGGSAVGQAFTLSVQESATITSANARAFSLGVADSFTITTAGLPFPTITQSGALLPNGVFFTDNGDGTATIEGTATPGTVGAYPVTLTATNGVGTPATQTFTLTVDSAPVFTSAAEASFVVGAPGVFAITAVGDPAVSTITQTGALPTGVSFSDNGSGNATLSGTPAAGTEGTYPLVLTASNSSGNGVQNFVLTVQLAPAITSANTTTFAVGTAGTFSVTTTGAPAPDLSIVGTLPTGITFVDNGDGTGSLSGTAAAGTGGSHAFTIQADNGAGSPATQAFTLLIEEAPLVTSGNAVTFTVGTLGTFTVTTSGSPAPSITRGGAPALPTGVTFTDNGDGTGTLTGTPAVGMGAIYPLTFQATNGVGTSPLQSFTLTVDEAPSFTSAASTTFVRNTLGSFTVTTLGFPDATLSAGTLPAGVDFLDKGDGTATLSGTPTVSGSFPITITASNGIGDPVTQSFTLAIHQAPAIASAAATSFLELNAGSFTVTTTGFPVPTIARTGTLPAGVSFADNGDGTGTLSGTPAAGSSNTYALTFQATSAAGTSPTQNFTLTVQSAPQITSVNSTTFTAGAASSFAVATTGVPAPTVSATGTLPTGITFNTGTKTFEGTPSQIGTFTPIQLTATNGVGTDATQTFTLNVICPVITVSSTPPSVPDGVFNTTYAGATFTHVGGGTGTWSAIALPPGLTLDANTGVLSGTPSNTGSFNATITFTGMANCQGSTNATISVAPNAQPDSYTGGVGNTQFVVANHSAPSTPFFSFASSVLANDQGPSLTVTPATNATTTMGGQITIAANGAFTYTPQAGDAGNDSYTYTVMSNGVGAQATITLGLGANPVWYVNGGGGAGDGRSHSPLNSLTTLNGAGDVDDDGDYIYLYPGTYASGLTAEAGQTVWGAGAIFNPVSGLTIGAGVKPTLQGTVTIAGDNVTISSLGIATSGATGMTNTGTRTGLTVKNNVTVAATNASGVVFSGVSSTSGGAPNFGINFLSVAANNSTKGISLQNVNTVAGSFTITGSDGGDAGTLADAGTGGTIASMTQRGVELDNVSRAVSLNGMNFTNAGSTDAAAPSTNCDSPNTGDPTLCNAAIHLVDAGSSGSVALNTISVNGGSQLGIFAHTVTNLTMNTVEVENVGTDTHESGVMLQNLSGTGGIANGHFHNNSARQVYMVNTAGTLTSFTITGSTFENTFGPNGLQGLQIEAFNAGTSMTVHTGVAGNGNTFNNTFNMGWMAQANQGATVTASLIDSTVSNTNGITVQASSGGTLTTLIQNNQFTAGPQSSSGAIAMKTDGGGSMVARAIGNTIGLNGVAQSGTICDSCNGFFINPREGGSFDLEIIGNTIQNVNGSGISIQPGQAATQAFDAVITGNVFRQPGPAATTINWAIYIVNGVIDTPPDGGCMALTLGGTVTPPAWPSQAADAKNQILGTWNSSGGNVEVRVRRRFNTSINFPALSGGLASDVEAWIQARNVFDAPSAFGILSDAGVPFGSLATCNP